MTVLEYCKVITQIILTTMFMNEIKYQINIRKDKALTIVIHIVFLTPFILPGSFVDQAN